MNNKKDKNLINDEGFNEPKKEKESIQIYFDLDLVDNIAVLYTSQKNNCL